MLKNFFISKKINFFIKNSFYLDYFLKKKLNNKLKNLNKISILFLEKYLIEYKLKNIHQILPKKITVFKNYVLKYNLLFLFIIVIFIFF